MSTKYPLKSYHNKSRVIKVRLESLKKMITKGMLSEASDGTEEPKEGDASLDAQIDRYFAQYEGEAKSTKTEAVSFRTMIRQFLINEAGEDDKEEESSDVPADAGADEPGKMSADDIDMEAFANSVARLIENYDNLLEVKSTLVRRAKNFLAKSYAQDAVTAFEQTMREDHGIVPGESKSDVDNEDFTAPAADRAGSGGQGGAG